MSVAIVAILTNVFWVLVFLALWRIVVFINRHESVGGCVALAIYFIVVGLVLLGGDVLVWLSMFTSVLGEAQIGPIECLIWIVPQILLMAVLGRATWRPLSCRQAYSKDCATRTAL